MSEANISNRNFHLIQKGAGALIANVCDESVWDQRVENYGSKQLKMAPLEKPSTKLKVSLMLPLAHPTGPGSSKDT